MRLPKFISDFFDSYERNSLRILNVTADTSGGAFDAFVELTQRKKSAFRKERVEKREVRFTLCSDKGKSVFAFYDHECPELRGSLHLHECYAWIAKSPCWKYPLFSVPNTQLQEMVDEYWERNGIVASGSWIN